LAPPGNPVGQSESLPPRSPIVATYCGDDQGIRHLIASQQEHRKNQCPYATYARKRRACLKHPHFHGLAALPRRAFTSSVVISISPVKLASRSRQPLLGN
jgi:hypothetical protein